MAASATARCSELERKLVHLSVAIEDKSESIDLLVQAIQEAEVKLEHQYQVCNAELRLKYDETSGQHNAELENCLKQCSESIEEKKGLASELEEMIERKKQEEYNISYCFEEIGNGTEANISKAKEEWKAGEKQREQEWMTNKVNKVRKATLEALQPEVRRLLDRQRLEMVQIENEMETREKYLENELNKDYQIEFSEYKAEAESRKKVLVARRKERWLEQISTTQETYAEQMKKDSSLQKQRSEGSGEQILKELEKERTSAEERHERSLTKILYKRDKKLDESKRFLTQKLNELNERSRDLIKTIQDNDSEQKEALRSQQRAVVEKAFEEKMNGIKQIIRTGRDKNIEEDIRRNQKKETQFEHDFNIKTAAEKITLESYHVSKLACIKEEFSSKQRQLSESALAIKELKDGIQAYRDQLEMTQRRTSRVQDDIDKSKKHFGGIRLLDDDLSIQDNMGEVRAQTKQYTRMKNQTREQWQKINGMIKNFERYVVTGTLF